MLRTTNERMSPPNDTDRDMRKSRVFGKYSCTTAEKLRMGMMI